MRMGMGDQDLPVTVAVTRPDGSVEHVRVGVAVRHGEGFSLKLGELEVGSAKGAEPRKRAAAPSVQRWDSFWEPSRCSAIH